jgi:hypothetical protein
MLVDVVCQGCDLIEEADQEVDEVEEGGGGSGIVLCSSPPISVASIDFIAEIADFISLE